jgi:uncharacterized damage-inducible protein DinB
MLQPPTDHRHRLEILMRRSILVALAVAAVPASTVAQEMRHEHHDVGVNAIRPLYERVKDLYMQSADVASDELFAYRPAEDTRSFAELLGHVAGASYSFCSAALGEDNPNSTDFENTTGKAELKKALAEGFAYCDRAYAMSESKAMEDANLFGREGSRLWVLIFNVTHDSEHYGNLVTYFRANGQVPPSSNRGG